MEIANSAAEMSTVVANRFVNIYSNLFGTLFAFKELFEESSLISRLVVLQGGPGFIYMVNKRVVTPQKLQKQTDLQA